MTAPLFRSQGARVWDPRAKMVGALFCVVALLVNQRLAFLLGAWAALLVLWGAARLPWRTLLSSFRALGLLCVSTFVFQVLITPAGPRILGLPVVGLLRASAWCLRFTGIGMALGFVVWSTPPLMLAEGMESLLSPLKRWRVPVHDAVMVFTIALRFLPVLAGEFAKVRKAQIARGAGIQRRSLLRRVQGLLPMLVPVFVQALLRAEELATAMTARCYRGDLDRTSLYAFRLRWPDWLLMAAAITTLVAAIALR